MKSLKGRVAVITGGGSGFGRELAILCAREEMPVVLADVDVSGMEETLSLLAPGTTSISQRCDVSRASDVDELADITYRTFGECGVLFNNAGVGAAGPAWMATLDDWTWTIGVNLMGVVHGIRGLYSAHDRTGPRMPRRQHSVSGRPCGSGRFVSLLREQIRRRWLHGMSVS